MDEKLLKVIKLYYELGHFDEMDKYNRSDEELISLYDKIVKDFWEKDEQARNN